MRRRMTTLTRASTLLACLLGAGLPAQAEPTALEAKLAAKLAEPFVQNAAWETDYAAARAKAKAGDGVFFAYFTRSYAP